MSFDKLIDSAKFDAAMTASADAIRAKTGGTAKIPWDETTGLANAISGITFKTQSKSVTPKASSQTIKPDSGYNGLSQVTVNGDSDLKASNIAKGVNIFGVTGTLESGTQVATGTFAPTASQLMTRPTTVNGIPFKPTRVIFFVADDSVTGWGDGILFGDSEGNIFTCRYTIAEYDEDEEEWYYYTEVGTFDGDILYTGGGFQIQLNSDGFTIKSSSDGEYDKCFLHYSTVYRYIAIG